MMPLTEIEKLDNITDKVLAHSPFKPAEKLAVQTELPLIVHRTSNQLIQQRANDGYINATAMCKAANKQFNDYVRLKSTKPFVEALMVETGIPVTELIQTLRGGNPELQGTWVHPQVAIHLAQWLSPRFAVLISKWVFEWISGQTPSHYRLPDHIRRYLVNRHKIPPTHFSMLDQMTFRLLAPLEEQRYILPAKLMPDIALGRMFSRWLRENGHDPDTFPTYKHQFLDNRPTVDARLYPNEIMTSFNEQLESWLQDGRARKYFKKRDADALVPLELALEKLSPPRDKKEIR